MTNLTSSLTIKLVDDVSKPARTVAQALEQAGKKAQSIAKAMASSGATDRFVAGLSKLKLSAKDIEAVARSWKEYSASAKLAASASDWTASQTAGVRRWESTTLAALREVQREQARFAASTRKTAKEVGSAEHGGAWSRHGALGFAAQGAAAAVSAHGVFETIKEAVTAGARYQHETTALQNAGRTAAELAQIQAVARETAKTVPTSTLTENLRVINETTSAFGTLAHALENLGFMQKSASVLKAASPAGTAIDAADLGNKMARAFEERGTASNSEIFRREASEVMRAMAYSGGRFNPDELLNFAQQAKSSLQNYDIHFLSRIAPTLIGTQGGERAGTAANAFTSLIMGKANDRKQAEAWVKYGLLDPTKAIMKAGHAVSGQAGAVVNTPLALKDPLAWIETELLPRLQKKGVAVDDQMALSIALGTLARNQNANLFMNELAQLKQRQRLHKDEANIDAAGSLDEIYARNLKQDPTVGLTALTASLESLGAVASSPLMKTAGAAISGLASRLQKIVALGQQHSIASAAIGGTAAAGGLAGAGYLSWQFMNGFGLKTSASRLDIAAGHISAAADRLGLQGHAPGGGTPGEKGGGGVPGLGWRGLLTSLNFGSFAWNAASNAQVKYDAQNRPYMDPVYGKEVDALNRWYDRSFPSWSDIGRGIKNMVVPAAHAEPAANPFGTLFNVRAALAHEATKPLPPPSKIEASRPEAARSAHGSSSVGKSGGEQHPHEAATHPSPYGDLDRAAFGARTAVENLNTTVKPNIDISAIRAAQAAAAQLLATLSAISGAASGAASAVAGIKVPSIGAASRSSFTPGGDPGR